MQLSNKLHLRTRVGIRGDSNARIGSPRHVLLIDPTIYEEYKLPADSLRENLLVEGLESASLRSGMLLRGGTALFRLTLPCEVCKKLNAVRDGLAREVSGRRGWLARVMRGGVICEGDRLAIHPQELPRLDEKLSERVNHVLTSVPEGKVITFAHLTVTTGVTPKHVRVFPRMLRAAPSEIPIHRVVTSSGRSITEHVPRQISRLRAEGVPISTEGEVDRHFLWDGDPYLRGEQLHMYG